MTAIKNKIGKTIMAMHPATVGLIFGIIIGACSAIATIGIACLICL